MKKIILLFVAAIGISTSFVSCSKDDDASLVGKWEFSKQGAIISGNEILTNYEHSCATKNDYVSFLSNGTSNNGEFDSDCNEDIYTSTYTKNGKTITVIEDGETYTITIVKLSGSVLKTKIEDPETPGTFYVNEFNRVE